MTKVNPYWNFSPIKIHCVYLLCGWLLIICT